MDKLGIMVTNMKNDKTILVRLSNDLYVEYTKHAEQKAQEYDL